MARSIVAVLLGTLFGSFVTLVVMSIGEALVPTPEGFRIDDPNAAAQLLPAHFVNVLLAWGAGSFAGAFLASYFSTQRQVAHGLAVGCILLIFGIVQLTRIPHPTWFAVVGVLLFLPAAWAGASAQSLKLPGSHEGWIVANEDR
mgnify:FL=1